MIPVALAFLWELKSRRVTGVGMPEQHGELSVLGEVIRLPSRARHPRGVDSSRLRGSLRLFPMHWTLDMGREKYKDEVSDHLPFVASFRIY